MNDTPDHVFDFDRRTQRRRDMDLQIGAVAALRPLIEHIPRKPGIAVRAVGEMDVNLIADRAHFEALEHFRLAVCLYVHRSRRRIVERDLRDDALEMDLLHREVLVDRRCQH